MNKIFLWAILLLSSTLSSVAQANSSRDTKPNVIVIFADDMGWGDLSCYGETKYKTPQIDRLAAEGARLTQFYATAPYCAPSRASLLTGRYQFRSGMTKNPAPDGGVNDIGMPADEVTLGEAFQKGGYRTACVGKWHLGHTPKFNPLLHGFDDYLGVLYSHDMRPVQLIDGTNVVEYPVIVANLTKKYTARALQFIEKNKKRPFFLYMPHSLPHKPLAASEELYKTSGGGLYGDAMLEVDRSVGAVMAKLDELGISKNTLVIFMSDNGPWYGGSSGGLRGMKGTTWEGGIRVPMIARWPGKIPAGHISHQPAVTMDIFPTVLKLAKIDLPKNRVLDGKDIWPLLTSDASTPHDNIFSFAGDGLRTVRSGQWKLHVASPGTARIVRPDEKWLDKRAPDGVTIIAQFEQAHPSEYPGVLTGDETRAGSLFDLEADAAEQRDISAENPEIVARLQEAAEIMLNEMGDIRIKHKGKPGKR